jgi:hypothetical protein
MRTNYQVPPGQPDLFIGGRAVTGTTVLPNTQTGANAATAANAPTPTQYPSLHFEALAIRGQKNILLHPIYLPPLLMSQAKVVGGNEDISIKIPGFEGFEMIVKANSVTFPDGSRIGPLVISPVHADRLPMVPPGGSATFMAPAWTIQPSGTRFDPPIEVRIPNSRNLKPGETSQIYQWDHDLATFVPMGQATVSEDGALLVTDAGSGVSKAGWGGAPPTPPSPPNCGDQGSSKDECRFCEKKESSGGSCPSNRCVVDPQKNNRAIDSVPVFPPFGFKKEFSPQVVGTFFLRQPTLSAELNVKPAQLTRECCEKELKAGVTAALDGGVILETAIPFPPFPFIQVVFSAGGNIEGKVNGERTCQSYVYDYTLRLKAGIAANLEGGDKSGPLKDKGAFARILGVQT